MRERDPGIGRRLLAATALSVAVHVAALPGLEALLLQPVEPSDLPPPAAVTVLGDAEVDDLIAAIQDPPPTVPQAPLPPPPKPPAPRPDGQVVEIPPPEREETPDDARFLSEYDSKVDREQVSARNAPPTPAMRKSDRRLISTGDDLEGAVDGERNRPQEKEPERTAAEKREGDAERQADRQRAEQRAPTPADRRRTEQATPLTEGAGPFRRADEAGDRRAAAPPSGGQAGGAPAPPSYKALLPTLGPEEMAAMQGSIDHVEDVEKGEATFLNTREYKFAWFFNRVKRSVQQQWNAVDVHRRYDPYGKVYGVRDRLTVVEVTLNADGTLDDIYVKKDSGVAFLDEAALRAFREAAPFPNPPDGLRDDDGRIRFSFGFYLEINGRGFRMFRYR